MPVEWKDQAHTRRDQVITTRLKGGLDERVAANLRAIKKEQESEELARLRIENTEFREAMGRMAKQIDNLRVSIVPETIEKWQVTSILVFGKNQFPIICYVDPLKRKVDLEMDEVQIKAAISKELTRKK
jgi:hypothetical protein